MPDAEGMCVMSYERPAKLRDVLRDKINWNSCIILVWIVIAVVIVILLELHIRKLSIYSGFPNSVISLRSEMLAETGSATLVSLLSENDA